jgi:hypothetical protein
MLCGWKRNMEPTSESSSCSGFVQVCSFSCPPGLFHPYGDSSTKPAYDECGRNARREAAVVTPISAGSIAPGDDGRLPQAPQAPPITLEELRPSPGKEQRRGLERAVDPKGRNLLDDVGTLISPAKWALVAKLTQRGSECRASATPRGFAIG